MEKSHSQVLRYEKDETDAPAGYLTGLALLTGVYAGWLLTGLGDPLTPPTAAELRLQMVRAALEAPFLSESGGSAPLLDDAGIVRGPERIDDDEDPGEGDDLAG